MSIYCLFKNFEIKNKRFIFALKVFHGIILKGLIIKALFGVLFTLSYSIPFKISSIFCLKSTASLESISSPY